MWDRIAKNEFADVVTAVLASFFPGDPPRFMARTPHGYYDPGVIAADLAQGGFIAAPRFATLASRGKAASPRIAAIAYCQGTPLRNEIEARDAARLGAATDAAEEAIAVRFGRGAVDGKIQALVVAVERCIAYCLGSGTGTRNSRISWTSGIAAPMKGCAGLSRQ